ncbi:MAG: PEGA domain-containing protein [Deltaproteobacteria bacterium]|nr:MAG: PEGA domain-containing protein [Deltaproteobacteria bacterium]
MHHLLAKSPADRVQSADELIRAIDALTPERALGSTGPRAALPAATSPTVTTLSGSASTSMLLPGSGRRARLRLVAFIAAMATIAVGVVVLVMRGGDVRPMSRPAAPVATAPSPAAPPAVPSAAPAAEPTAAPAASTATPAASTATPAVPSNTAPDPGSRAADPSVPPERAAQLPPEPATVEVAIDSSPPGAQVVVDGTVVGTTPFHGRLPRRDRDVKLVIRLAGYVDRTVVAHASHPITERVKLVRPATPPRSSRTTRDQSYNPF